MKPNKLSRPVRMVRPVRRRMKTTARPVGLAARVRELEERLRELQAAKAASGNRDFLAEVAHELRTPLAAMLLWVNLLAEQDNVPPAMQEGVEAIRRCVDEQLALIEVLADVSRVVTGKLRLETRPTDLASVVRSAVAEFRTAAKAGQVLLEETCDLAVGVVRVDAHRLHQVVRNLLGNAVRFTPGGGRVTLRLRRMRSDVMIEVTDTGAGITPEFLPGIFDRLHRDGDKVENPTGGLGFGLAIARHLVELHGGTVAARSAGRGQGSTFIVTLPLPALDRTALEKVEVAG